MDSFRNFMENNQYLEGGATAATATTGMPAPTSGSAPVLPTISPDTDLSNLVKNADALVKVDKDLTGRVKALEAKNQHRSKIPNNLLVIFQ